MLRREAQLRHVEVGNGEKPLGVMTSHRVQSCSCLSHIIQNEILPRDRRDGGTRTGKSSLPRAHLVPLSRPGRPGRRTRPRLTNTSDGWWDVSEYLGATVAGPGCAPTGSALPPGVLPLAHSPPARGNQ